MALHPRQLHTLYGAAACMALHAVWLHAACDSAPKPAPHLYSSTHHVVPDAVQSHTPCSFTPHMALNPLQLCTPLAGSQAAPERQPARARPRLPLQRNLGEGYHSPARSRPRPRRGHPGTTGAPPRDASAGMAPCRATLPGKGVAGWRHRSPCATGRRCSRELHNTEAAGAASSALRPALTIKPERGAAGGATTWVPLRQSPRWLS